MRDTYRDQLDEIVNDLVTMTDAVQKALVDGTSALLNPDLQLAEQVISGDALIDQHHDEVERNCFLLLARQAPVAGELRTVVATLRMLTSLARMGDLAAHIAKVARLRFPDPAIPEPLKPNFERMCAVATSMVETAGRTLANRDVDAAHQLAASDWEMDELRRRQFQILFNDKWSHGIEAAVDVALLGRYYERIADHSVALARQIIYVATGEPPEGEEWPHN